MIKVTGKTKRILLTAMVFSMLSGCGQSAEVTDLSDYPIEHELEFGGAYIKITNSDFMDLGYQPGDSVTVSFSNGYVLEDIPFYDGYYVMKEEPLLLAYPGYPYIKAAVKDGKDLWITAGLSDTDTASVSLYTKGKYLEFLNARELEQIDDRDFFASDKEYANFRMVKGGSLKENLIYRSSSPIDNTYGRVSCVNELMEEAGIRYVIDLSDTEESVEKWIKENKEDSACFADLYQSGNVLLPQLNTRYETPEIKKNIADILREMCSHQGPYLIHCMLGKDRSGFISILLEMLAGADYQTILDDYMESYANFYQVTVYNSPEKYEIIKAENFHVLMRTVVNDENADPESADYVFFAEAYLKDGGMSDEDLAVLKHVILEE